MAKGDRVFISPDVTHKSVISAQTADGNIYFDKAYNFHTTI